MTQGYNPFAGMREAKVFTSGNYFPPGKYKAQISKMVWQQLFKGGEALIVELKVLESSNEKVPVGSDKTWLQKKNESFLAEAKCFLYAALGFDQKNDAHAAVIKKDIEPACEAIMLEGLTKNLFKGREIHIEVYEKPKKAKPDEVFNKHVFAPAQPPMGAAA